MQPTQSSPRAPFAFPLLPFYLLLSHSISGRNDRELELDKQQASMSWIHRIIAGFCGTGTPPDVRKVWGRSFKWSPLHPTPEQLAETRGRWDTLADEALARLNAVRDKRDLYTTLKEDHKTDDVLTELWSEINDIPEWVDWEQIERGQEVFCPRR